MRSLKTMILFFCSWICCGSSCHWWTSHPTRHQGGSSEVGAEPSTVLFTSQQGLRWGCRREHLHMAFLWGLGFLVLWWLVLKARVPREWESHVDTMSLLLIYFELTQCHFCHILSVKAVTESRPESTKGRKSKLPRLRGCETFLKEQYYCCGHFGKQTLPSDL